MHCSRSISRNTLTAFIAHQHPLLIAWCSGSSGTSSHSTHTLSICTEMPLKAIILMPAWSRMYTNPAEHLLLKGCCPEAQRGFKALLPKARRSGFPHTELWLNTLNPKIRCSPPLNVNHSVALRPCSKYCPGCDKEKATALFKSCTSVCLSVGRSGRLHQVSSPANLGLS